MSDPHRPTPSFDPLRLAEGTGRPAIEPGFFATIVGTLARRSMVDGPKKPHRP
jgi:hypothetical protein